MAVGRFRTSQAGMTLIEVMIAGLIMVVGVLGVVAMIDTANNTTKRTRAREAGTNLAREVVEAARGIGFAQLDPSTVESQLKSSAGLADASGGNPWTVERRGTEYTLGASVCTLDDPQDGMGTHPTTVTWCPDVGAAGATDINGAEDYKRITVNVTWTEGGEERSVRQSSLVNNTDSGPRVTLAGPLGSGMPNGQITTAVTARFEVTTSQAANRVEWYLDGTYQTQATQRGPTSYDFTWNLGAAPCAGPAGAWDGSYFVSAQAFNRVGDSPGPRAKTVTVNRCPPLTPTIDRGGRNLRPAGGPFIEVEWLPNPERDIIGYRVYRVGESSPQTGSTSSWASGQACAGDTTFDATSCVFDDPAPGSTLLYQVVAVDRAPDGAERESPVRSTSITAATNTGPNAPRDLTRTTLTNGDVRLDWQQPTGNDTSFYRIYRGGTALSQRYDESTTTTYTDSDPNGSAYYVVAVDPDYSEGAVAGPVSP